MVVFLFGPRYIGGMSKSHTAMQPVIRYHSTRGKAPELSFDDVVLAGLASDGGLYVPTSLPHFTTEQIARWQGMDYPSLACEILRPFFVGSRLQARYEQLIADSYAEFRHTATAPLKQLSSTHFLLELFHGPTLAFKDFALQFLGRLLDALLEEEHESVTVLGATSGDTGSAAIAGCHGRRNMRIAILHPHGRVSEVQRRQMTTILDDNVHNLAIEGSFDDCQHIVKSLFTDAEFRQKHRLTAVNSINWARIMAQIVYYFYAALTLGAPHREVSFCVPTGNFGDIYAGYLAKQMGLPIQRLMIATNHNDILTRCVKTGKYHADTVVPSLSPSMDIQVSSNFERLLFGYYKQDSAALAALMEDLKTTGEFALPAKIHQQLQRDFAAYRVDDDATLQQISASYKTTEEILDPHSAIGVNAAENLKHKDEVVVTLATAHAAKFPDAVEKAIGQRPALPHHLKDLFEKEERFTQLAANDAAVKAYLEG